MIITQITYQKKDPSRVNIFVDGVFTIAVSVNTLAKENLYESKEIDTDTLERISLEDLFERFFNRAVEYLARSPKTEFQIRKYLKELKYKKQDKWFDKSIPLKWDIFFEDIISKLKEYKYIDDEIFAKAFVGSRLSNKPSGKSVLIGELISKGVSKDIAQNVCDEFIDDEYDVLKSVFRKRYKEQKLDLKDNKMVGFLMRKGFSWDLIEKFSRDESEE